MKKTTLSLLTLLFCISIGFTQSTATYNVEFTNYWNATDHNNGTPLPNNAHWSDLVITNHNSNVTFFEMNGTASAGVELIAELGDVSTFQNNDYQNAFNANNAEQFVNAGDLFLNTGNTINHNGLQVSEDFPLVSVLSMIAPSPDWFIGVNSLNLRDNSGWRNSITIDLFPYDAGTEEGSAYSISNSATNPQETIQSIQNVAPFNNERVATITFTLQSTTLSTSEELSTQFKIYPNPANNFISIKKPNNIEIKTIEVFSVLGKRVTIFQPEKNVTNLRFNTSNLNSGIYLLRLNTNESKHITQKIIIN